MTDHRNACPHCGSEKLTTVRLPVPGRQGEPPSTRIAWRCLECDAQWTREDEPAGAGQDPAEEPGG